MASKTIGQLESATSVDSSDLIEIEQSGVSKYASFGQIIESDTNSTGSYIKYCDGTIQQWGRGVSSTMSGTTFTQTIDFPTEFINTDYSVIPVITRRYPGGSAASTTIPVTIHPSNFSLGSVLCRINSSTSEAAGTYFDYMYTAIGQWK
jgi:hypothetical protein